MVAELVAAVLALALSSAADSAEPAPGLRHVPGTRVSLVPPAGLLPAQPFRGFHGKRGWIEIVEIEAPLQAVRERGGHAWGVTRRTVGFSEPSEVFLLADGTSAELWIAPKHLRQRIPGGCGLGESRSDLTLVFGDPAATVLIFAKLWPDSGDPAAASVELAAVLASARWDRASPLLPLEGEPVDLQLPAGWKYAGARWNCHVWTLSGLESATDTVSEPRLELRLAKRPRDGSPEGEAKYAVREWLYGCDRSESEPRRVDAGRDGIEFYARAEECDDWPARGTYAFALREHDLTVVLMGTASLPAFDAALPDFRSAALGLRVRAP